MTKNYMTKRDEVLTNMGASYWLKAAIVGLEKRDPVDAFNDAEILRKLAFQRMEETFNGAEDEHKCERLVASWKADRLAGRR